MGTTVNERVRKYRAKKMSTTEGAADIRSNNRKYKARSRLKKLTKRLSDEKEILRISLNDDDQLAIKSEVSTLKTSLMEAKAQGGKPLNEDEEREVDYEVLKYEVELMKEKEKEREIDLDSEESPYDSGGSKSSSPGAVGSMPYLDMNNETITGSEGSNSPPGSPGAVVSMPYMDLNDETIADFDVLNLDIKGVEAI